MRFIFYCMRKTTIPMNDIEMSFDEYLTLKALKFKESVSGQGNRWLLAAVAEHDTAQAEAIGMKNMCFRVDPVLQARFETTIDALGISKQEALTEMLAAMLDQIDKKLADVGLGALTYDTRLRELGFELREAATGEGKELRRIEPAKKG